MANILCTFSGRYGDILWSLPTVRSIGYYAKEKVDMGIMPEYASLIPLLATQSYIDKAFEIPHWLCEGSPYGDQPWQSPHFEGKEKYKVVFELTYKEHPRGVCLADWIRKRANGTVNVKEDIPFIEVHENSMFLDQKHIIAVAFNSMYSDIKIDFLNQIKSLMPEYNFIDASTLDWLDAAFLIKESGIFIGCRSSNYVLAHGVGAKVIVFEPHPMRTGPVFNCPFGIEVEVTSPEMVRDTILQWRECYEFNEAHAG